jgi:hypothetical protein
MITETYATFAKGDVVKAAMNTTYLKAGETYKVFRFTELDGVTSRTYWVSDEGGNLYPVCNGHITLAKVGA